MEKTLHRKKASGGRAIVYIVLLLGCFITLAPFLWMFLTSFKTQVEAVSIPPSILPRHWDTSSYLTLSSKLPFWRMYGNTVLTAIIIVTAQLTLCSLAGYAFARIHFPGRDALFVLCLAVLMIPSSFLILPQYLTIQKMGLLNTLRAVYLPNK